MRRKYHHLTSPAMLSHAGYSPGRHLPRTLYLASSRLNLHTREKKKKVQNCFIQLYTPCHCPGDTVVIFTVCTRFILASQNNLCMSGFLSDLCRLCSVQLCLCFIAHCSILFFKSVDLLIIESGHLGFN